LSVDNKHHIRAAARKYPFAVATIKDDAACGPASEASQRRAGGGERWHDFLFAGARRGKGGKRRKRIEMRRWSKRPRSVSTISREIPGMDRPGPAPRRPHPARGSARGCGLAPLMSSLGPSQIGRDRISTAAARHGRFGLNAARCARSTTVAQLTSAFRRNC